MDSINANKHIIIDNSRICSFYNNNRNIDIVTTNLFFIDFFENLTDTANSSNINTQLISFMNENKKQIEKLSSNIESVSDCVAKLNIDIANNLLIQLANNKKDYIEDVKGVVMNSSLTINEKINSMIHQNNEHLIDKTKILLNEIIPKNNETLNNQVQNTFKQLNEQISDDTHKIITNNNNEKMLTDFISNFENKYNNTIQTIQQPLFSFFTASEDRINNNINVLKENAIESLSSQLKLQGELGEFLGKYKGSSNKGKFGEHRLESVLNETYCDAEIINTSGTKASGDFIMKRFDRPTIMFENKEYDFNVPKDEVHKFIRDAENLNTNGVLISHNTGIVYKHNFQIDVNRNNVLVYIHNCDYSPDKIKTAVDIIDYLYKQIQVIGVDDDNTNVITTEMLNCVNDDFQKFVSQKESLLMIVKDFNKKISSQIEDIQFPTLEKYLSNKYASVKSKCLVCDICNDFSARNKQSMAAHKRACNKKPSTVTITTIF